MTSKKMRPTRFAHFEGHTDLCYTDDGRYIITCGSDGEVRIFEGLDDDDCKTHVVAESAHSIAYKNGCFLVGTDSNLVQAFTMDEGNPDGIITRFTAPATHIVVSKDRKTVVCAGSDMTVRIHDAVMYKDTILSGHQAPVLSVALDPKGEYIASSSCDGSVRVWEVKTSANIASWAILPKTNNFSSSRTLCRLMWSPDGSCLYVPVEREVRAYERNSWNIKQTYEDSSVKQTISVVAVSNCGQYLAGACMDGVIVVWNTVRKQIILSEQHPKNLPICGLTWNPSGKKEVAFVNVDGQLGTLENIDKDYTAELPVANGLVNGVNDHSEFPPLDVDVNDDDEYDISKIKSKLGFADDEEGTYLGLTDDVTQADLKAGDDGDSVVTTRTESAPAPIMQLPEFQKPFQPGMSPEFLNDRYMVWNNVGIVRQYTSDDENSIDVEFHDTSIHHALHLNNSVGHSMGALSNEALALACESQDDQPSKLVVQHFSAWGSSSKEWYVDMPPEEDILALCLGAGWVAVATDRRNLRIFSTSGVQRDLLNIPGPIVCLAGFENQLMFIFHSGMGVSGDQQMSAVVLNLDGGRHLIPTSCPLPLSPKSFLAWAGFSDEGTPVIMDSAGIIRILHYKYGVNWTSALNTKNHTRGKSDHYFLVGLSEMQSNVRCILCKGSRYPPVLPKPHVSMIDLQMPLCELDTEKGGLEEKALRTGRLLTSLERLTHLGYDVDQSKSEADIALKEALIKLFALACRTERESRAIEVCKLMPSYQTVQLAIKYAGKLHRLQLADRLGDVASAKMEEEIEKESRNHTYLDRENMPSYSASVKKYQYGTSDDEMEDDMNQEQEQENESADPETHDNPLLAAAIRRENSSTKSSLLLSPSTKNPFKKNTPSSGHQSGKRGIDVIDKFRKAQRKPENSPVLRPFVKKLQSKQTTLKKKLTSEDVNGQDVTDKENKSANTIDTSTPSTMNPFKKHESQNSALEIKQVEKEAPVKRPSALQLWLDDNEEKVKTQFPEATDKDLILKAALIFKDVDGEVKQKYKALAAGGVLSPNVNIQTPIPVPADEEKKRKIDSFNNQESPLEKKAKGSGVKKLSAFAFNKDTDV